MVKVPIFFILHKNQIIISLFSVISHTLAKFRLCFKQIHIFMTLLLQ